MKKIFLGLFTITSVISMAQAKLGMGISYAFTPTDTVLANTTVTLTTYVVNKGNAPFFGTYTLNIALNNASITPIASDTSSTTLNIGDSIVEITTFTSQTGVNGWKVAGNGNVIVVWPISTGLETKDSLKTILTVIEPNGILDVEKNIFMMYPNPIQEVLFIKPNDVTRFDTYTVYDIEAREIETGKYNEAIYIKNLPKGMYWLVLTTNEKRYKQRFIKD